MEANAAKNAIFEQDDNTEMALAVDSTVLAACFRNKRAKNRALNTILLEIYEEMARARSWYLFVGYRLKRWHHKVQIQYRDKTTRNSPTVLG